MASELIALQQIQGIRQRRVETAEDHLRLCQQQQQKANAALEAARHALADYQQRLPGLIEQLYVDCIGHLVSREFVQGKTHEETRLRARVEDFKAKVLEAQRLLEQAIEAVRQAQITLNKERVKLDALRELIKYEKKKLVLADSRAQAKVLDDLASSKFVRSMVKPTLH